MMHLGTPGGISLPKKYHFLGFQLLEEALNLKPMCLVKFGGTFTLFLDTGPTPL